MTSSKKRLALANTWRARKKPACHDVERITLAAARHAARDQHNPPVDPDWLLGPWTLGVSGARRFFECRNECRSAADH
jgi:hypothetical protein